MNKSVRAFLALVIGAALAVMILLFQHMLDIRREVSSVTLQLEESVSSWSVEFVEVIKENGVYKKDDKDLKDKIKTRS